MRKYLFLFIFCLIIKQNISKDIIIDTNEIYYSKVEQDDDKEYNFILNNSNDTNIIIHLKSEWYEQSPLNVTIYKNNEIINRYNNISSISLNFHIEELCNYTIKISTLNDTLCIYHYLIYFYNQKIKNLYEGEQIVHFINPSLFYFIQPLNTIINSELLHYLIKKKAYTNEYNYSFYYKLYINTTLEEIENNLPSNQSEFYGELYLYNNSINYTHNLNNSINNFLLIGLFITRKYDTTITYNYICIQKNFFQIDLKSNFTIQLKKGETKEFNCSTNINSFLIYISEKTENVLETNGKFISNNLLYYFNKNLNTQEFFIKFTPNKTLKYVLLFIDSYIDVSLFNYFSPYGENIFMERIEMNQKHQYYLISINHNYLEKDNQRIYFYPKIIYGEKDIDIFVKNLDENEIFNLKSEDLFLYPFNISSKQIIQIKLKNQTSSSLIHLMYFPILNNNDTIMEPIGKIFGFYLIGNNSIKINTNYIGKEYNYIIEIVQSKNNDKCLLFDNITIKNNYYSNNTLPKSFSLSSCNNQEIFFLIKVSYIKNFIEVISKEILKKKFYNNNTYALKYINQFPYMILNFKNENNNYIYINLYDDFIPKDYIYSPSFYTYQIIIEPFKIKELIIPNPYNNTNKNDFHIVIANSSEILVDFYYSENHTLKNVLLIFSIIIGIILCIFLCFLIYFHKFKKIDIDDFRPLLSKDSKKINEK